YEDKNFTDDAEQVWRQVEQLDPQDPDILARKSSFMPPPPEPPPGPVATTRAPPYAGATAAMPAYAPSQPLAPPPAPVAAPSVAAVARPKGENLGKLLTETDVYVKYGLHDKALEHLRKVFALEPENIDAHEKAYAIYVASNNHAQSFEQLLNVLRLHTRSGDAARAQPYLATILQQNPGHPEVPVFLSALRMADGGAGAQQPQEDSQEAEDAILVDSSDDEVIVADEPEEVLSGEAAVVDEPFDGAEMIASDEVMLSPPDADAAAEVEVEPPPVPDEYVDAGDQQELVSDFEGDLPPLDADEPTTGEFPAAVEEEEQSTGALEIPVQTRAAPGLGEEESEAPTRMAPRMGFESRAAPALEESFEDVEPPTASTTIAEEAVEAPPEEEPAAEECDEATFFVEQGLFEEAREILETVLIAYPEHRRAAELMARVEALESGDATPAHPQPAPTASNGEEEGRDAFDLAAELANELGDFGEEQAGDPSESLPGAGGDDYQVSVEEVFAEFKKGLEKVVKPEDVDTHYDLGVAYKEMGLIDDAVGEFSIARKGCIGKRKEIDCLSMIGMLQVSRGDTTAAIDAYLQALASEHAKGDVEKSLRYELGAAYEAANQSGRALAQYLKVQSLDGRYRDVQAHVDRLSAIAAPEEDAPVPPKPPTGSRPGARKVGYV
ncbi:MAG: tetratricopeptide repeat protein, partial [Archangium sp.]